MSVRLIFIGIFAFCLSLIFGSCVFTACFDGGDGDSDDDDDDDDDADDDDTDDDDLEPDTWGGIGISEGYSSSNYTSLDYYCGVGASFYDPDECDEWGYGEPDDEEGDCKLYHWSGDTEACHTLSGGRVTVTGANVSPIHLDPVSYQYGYYYQADVDFLDINNLFDENDTFNAHVAGASGIGPLDVSVDAPPMISVTKPVKFDSLDLLPSSAMTFQWNEGGAEKVFLTLSTYNITKTTMNGVVIVCEAPDEQGEIVVSSDLMEEFLDDPDTMSVMISKSNNKISEGSKPVYFTASTYRQRTYIQVK